MMKVKEILSDQSRSGKIRKNALQGGLIKGASIILSLILVPLILKYVDESVYGLWLSISSLSMWLSFFDIGLNNGLKNKLGIALANNDKIMAKKLVSTTYAILSLIFIPLAFVLVTVIKQIDLCDVINVHIVSNVELVLVVSFVIVNFCLRFILSTINVVAFAHQSPAISSFENLLEQLLTLISIIILSFTTKGNLIMLALVYSLVPIVTLLIFSILLYKTKYNSISPSFKNIDLSLSNGLIGLGFQFFIIQIAGLVMYQSSNFIIIKYFGPEDVTKYNIAFKYFNVLTIGMNIFSLPLWSAITDAYALKDYRWIQNSIKKYSHIALGGTVIGFVMLLFSNEVYKLWLGSDVVIPTTLSVCFFIYNSICLFSGIFCSFTNGTGMLKVQFLSCLVSPFVFIFACYLFIEVYNCGVYSIIIAMLLSGFNGYILAPLQYHNWVKQISKNEVR
ncbi:hypothetical protein [Phocaeicola sp.]|uniref:lipopolysaccharide biosynthesis protein n=1 Tax=Phocaeicola sp. TaxID=2773926 RepID=UPI0023CC08FA|nr:hypothetical protein [Phocaeicola sp.]MDE5678592.1 hypothetical protein [Phocaeicola sp.]